MCAKVTVCDTLMSMHSSGHILLVLTMNSAHTFATPGESSEPQLSPLTHF